MRWVNVARGQSKVGHLVVLWWNSPKKHINGQGCTHVGSRWLLILDLVSISRLCRARCYKTRNLQTFRGILLFS
jgi:hypothetical protein